MTDIGRSMLFAYGAFGAAIQDVLLFFSKRFSAPALDFNAYQYATALIIYCLSAGVVATIYPYRKPVTAWKGFLVGILLPSIIGGAVAVAHRAGPDGFDVTLRGPAQSNASTADESVYGSLADLLALF